MAKQNLKFLCKNCYTIQNITYKKNKSCEVCKKSNFLIKLNQREEKIMDFRMSLPDSAKPKLKKEAEKRYMTMNAYVRLIVAEKLNELK